MSADSAPDRQAAQEPASAPAAPGTEPLRPTIPGYDLLRLIGRGSYGDVWLARDLIGLPRAIKIVWRTRFAEAKPFEREFAGLGRFSKAANGNGEHLAILHVGRDDSAGFFYYVMELADDVDRGRDIDLAHYRPLTLDWLLAHRGRLPPAECLTLTSGIARAVAALHAQDLVHRDIKPSNILFFGGAPKLADVGLVASACQAVTIVGTEGYIPPEGPGAPSADVFGLGKVLYEMATGQDRRRFPTLPPELLAHSDRRAFLELNEIVHRACALDASRRYRNATAMLSDLRALAAGRSLRRRSFLKRSAVVTAALAAIPLTLSLVPHVPPYFGSQDEGPGPPPLPAHSEAQRLVTRADQLLAGVFNRSEVEAADELARRASALAPDLADAWALQAYAAACRLLRGWDQSVNQAIAVQELAHRALVANPSNATALLALAILFGFQGAHDRAEATAREGIASRQTDPRLWRILFRAVFDQGRQAEGAALADEATSRFPADALLHYDRALLYGRIDDFTRLEAGVDSALALSPVTAVLTTKAALRLEQHGDLAGTRATLERIPTQDRTEDRVIAAVMTLGLVERRPDQVIAAAALSANPYITDLGTRAGPKAFWLALARRQQGLRTLEREQWQDAVAVLRQRIAGSSRISSDQARLAIALAWLERADDAQREIHDFEAVMEEQPSIESGTLLAIFYAGRGAIDQAIHYLAPTLGRWGGLTHHFVRLHPWWDKVRDDPRFSTFLAAVTPAP